MAGVYGCSLASTCGVGSTILRSTTAAAGVLVAQELRGGAPRARARPWGPDYGKLLPVDVTPYLGAWW
jgi:hypothetical protein